MVGEGIVYVHDISGNVLSLNSSGQLNVTGSGNAVSTSGNTTRIYGFDGSGNAWGTVNLSYSGSNAMNVSEWDEPSYITYADNSAVMPGTSGFQFAIMHTSGAPAVHLKTLYIVPTPENAQISGQAIKFNILRISSTSGGGTAISGFPFDPIDPACVPLTIQHRVLSGCVVTNTLMSWVTTTQNLASTNQPQLSGILFTGYDALHIQQGQNILNRSEVETRDITLRSGQGIAIQQTTGAGYTTVASGSFNIMMTYSQV